MKKNCPTCKKQFFKTQTESKKSWKNRRVYCSKKCQYPVQATLKCLECNKEFKVRNYRKNTAHFCSQKCSHKNRINKDYPVNYAIRRRQVYEDWRTAVFIKDNYTCQECGIKNGRGKTVFLNADHIKPLRDIVKENKLETIEQMMACKELWDINNGRTLCIGCHKKTSTYGVNAWRRPLFNRCVASV